MFVVLVVFAASFPNLARPLEISSGELADKQWKFARDVCHTRSNHLVFGAADANDKPACFAAGKCVHAACATQDPWFWTLFSEGNGQQQGGVDRLGYFAVTEIKNVSFCGDTWFAPYAELLCQADFKYVNDSCHKLKPEGGQPAYFAGATVRSTNNQPFLPLLLKVPGKDSYFVNRIRLTYYNSSDIAIKTVFPGNTQSDAVYLMSKADIEAVFVAHAETVLEDDPMHEKYSSCVVKKEDGRK